MNGKEMGTSGVRWTNEEVGILELFGLWGEMGGVEEIPFGEEDHL